VDERRTYVYEPKSESERERIRARETKTRSRRAIAWENFQFPSVNTILDVGVWNRSCRL
jgi:hypothetical protein